VFKGGTALKRCYFGDYRFSEDLDFTLAEELTLDPILAGLEEVYDEVRRASGVAFHYARADRKQHQNSHTFYLAYEGPLPAASAKEVKVDITIRERFVCGLSERSVLRGYDEYADLPEGSAIRVYALDEIAVEKVAALTDRARTEPRDLYDVWYLTTEAHVDLALLAHELDSKLEFRGRSRDGMNEELARKEARYKKLWSIRLGAQMAQIPPFAPSLRGRLPFGLPDLAGGGSPMNTVVVLDRGE
jgi:predicted nucleotidyltransferase component of viral defense system